MKQFFSFIQTAVLLVCTVTLSGQRPGPSYGPGFIKWIDDDRMLIRMYDEEKQPEERIEKNLVTAEYNCKTGKSVRVAEYRTELQQLSDLLPEGVAAGPDMAVSSDRKSVVILRDNDLWYYSSENREGKRLTYDGPKEMNARFAPGDKKLAYTKERDLYVYDLDALMETRLTFDATDKIYNGWASWVYMEEILGRGSRYAAFWWSPDGSRIAYLHTDDNPVPLYYLNALENTEVFTGDLR